MISEEERERLFVSVGSAYRLADILGTGTKLSQTLRSTAYNNKEQEC